MLCCIVFSDGSMAIIVATLVGVTTMGYIKHGFAAISRSGVLEPDLDDARWEIEFATQSVNLVTLRTRLLGKISLQNLKDVSDDFLENSHH